MQSDQSASATGAEGIRSNEQRRVAFLNQVLWRQLDEAQSPETFAQAWLELQCRIIGDVEAGAVVLGPAEQGPFRAVATMPEGAAVEGRLHAAAERAIAERRGVAQANKGRSAALAFPLFIAGELHGVAALELAGPLSSELLRQRMRELQWGAQALQYALYRSSVGAELARRARVQQALELLAGTVDEPSFEAAAISLATELANRYECERVSIGFRTGKRTTVRALSRSAQFSKRMNIVRLIANAMDEAIDQAAIVVYPAPDDVPQLDIAHRELTANAVTSDILTVPFSSGERILGAIQLERSAGRRFTMSECETVECVAGAVGPVLDVKRRNERLLALKIVDSTGEQLKRLLGPNYVGRKLVAVAAAGVIAFFALATGTYRVTADASLEGVIQRSVVAAFDGYVEAEFARAGDVVEAGSALAALDRRDLELERSRRLAERAELSAEYGRALASAERAEINVLSQRLAQVDAQINLVETHIERATIVAPFDGIVVKGDLSQLVGTAVTRGEELFQIAPLDAYRVNLRIDEGEVAFVEPGQPGTLVLSSLPEEPLQVTVQRLTPLAEASDGRTYFRVEAELEGVSERIRPGMEGVAKIDIDERRLIWIWTRGLVDWARLTIWRYWP